MEKDNRTFESKIVHSNSIWVEIITVIKSRLLIVILSVFLFVWIDNTFVQKLCILYLIYYICKCIYDIFYKIISFRNLSYYLTSTSLHIENNGWLCTELIIPLNRIQHVKRAQTVISRMFSLYGVIVQTAGDHEKIHYLTNEESEQLTTMILKAVGNLSDGEENNDYKK